MTAETDRWQRVRGDEAHLLGLMLLAAACSASSSGDCPNVDTADLDCPVRIDTIEASACQGIPDGAAPPQVDAEVTSDTLHVEVGAIVFRDDNEVCGFATRRDDEVRVLLQPCVLVPAGGVSKGDCWYESIAFDVEDVELSGAQTVTVVHRVDRPVEFPPHEPTELGSVVLE